MGSTLSIFLIAFIVLIIVGPEKLPQSAEQLWLALDNFKRQQNNLSLLSLTDARKIWRASGSPFYAIIGGLYQGAEHLTELRRRLLTAGIVFFVAAVGSMFFTKYIFVALKIPAGNIQLIFTKPAEMILTWFKVALLAGMTFALPLLVYELVLFIYPAFETPQERRTFKFVSLLAVPTTFIFFVGGFAFAYFVMLPFALKYLFAFGSELAKPFWSISEYTTFVLGILFWIGVAFETPLVMAILSKLGVVNAKQLASKRRYAIIICAVAAAVITPTPDPFNMLLVMAPLVFLFELGIILSRLMGKPVRRK
jgi:sec-independent protein translocase protein TatC